MSAVTARLEDKRYKADDRWGERGVSFRSRFTVEDNAVKSLDFERIKYKGRQNMALSSITPGHVAFLSLPSWLDDEVKY